MRWTFQPGLLLEHFPACLDILLSWISTLFGQHPTANTHLPYPSSLSLTGTRFACKTNEMPATSGYWGTRDSLLFHSWCRVGGLSSHLAGLNTVTWEGRQHFALFKIQSDQLVACTWLAKWYNHQYILGFVQRFWLLACEAHWTLLCLFHGQ